MTTKVQGKIHRIRGPSILTGASMASFSARAKRSLVRWVDCALSTVPMLAPVFSACTSALTSDCTGGRSSRSSRERSASMRVRPERISRSRRAKARRSGLSGVFSTPMVMPTVKLQPDSTASVSMSRKFGRFFSTCNSICFMRSRSQMSRYTKPNAAPPNGIIQLSMSSHRPIPNISSPPINAYTSLALNHCCGEIA